MPKLHTLTPPRAEALLERLNNTRMSLFEAMQALNRYYRKDHRLVKRAQSFYDLFCDLKKDCEREFREVVEKP